MIFILVRRPVAIDLKPVLLIQAYSKMGFMLTCTSPTIPREIKAKDAQIPSFPLCLLERR